MKNNKENIDWNLAGKIVSGEASDHEHEKFNSWLNQDNNNDIWNQVQIGLDQTDYILTKEKVNIDNAWTKVKLQTISKKRRIKLDYTYSAIAASLLIIIGIFFIFPLFNNSSNLISYQTNDSIQQLILKDGSTVDINRNSTISYPETFSSSERNIRLKGEAFFDVTKDKSHPFIITTNAIKIKVLGTSFNVKENINSLFSEVTVKSGVVEVSCLENPENKVLLNIGEKATYNSNTNQLIKEINSNKNYLSWKTKEITFKNDNLNNAIELLESIYNIDINNDETIGPETLITATFEQNSIDFILNTINKTYNLNLNYTTKE